MKLPEILTRGRRLEQAGGAMLPHIPPFSAPKCQCTSTRRKQRKIHIWNIGVARGGGGQGARPPQLKCYQ